MEQQPGAPLPYLEPPVLDALAFLDDVPAEKVLEQRSYLYAGITQGQEQDFLAYRALCYAIHLYPQDNSGGGGAPTRAIALYDALATSQDEEDQMLAAACLHDLWPYAPAEAQSIARQLLVHGARNAQFMAYAAVERALEEQRMTLSDFATVDGVAVLGVLQALRWHRTASDPLP